VDSSFHGNDKQKEKWIPVFMGMTNKRKKRITVFTGMKNKKNGYQIKWNDKQKEIMDSRLHGNDK